MRKLLLKSFFKEDKIGVFPSDIIAKWASINPVGYIAYCKDTSFLNESFSHSNINSLHVQRSRGVLDLSCLNKLP